MATVAAETVVEVVGRQVVALEFIIVCPIGRNISVRDCFSSSARGHASGTARTKKEVTMLNMNGSRARVPVMEALFIATPWCV